MIASKEMPISGGWVEDILAAHVPRGPLYVVENLLFHGLNLIAGPPKAGKTNFAFQLAFSVAKGIPLFGQFRVVAGKVLYIALEEMPELTASRLAKMGVEFPPRSLQVEYNFPSLSKGGALRIGNFIAHNPGTKLVVVDVFQRLRGSSGKSSYTAEYNELEALQKIGNQSGVAIVLLHHTIKSRSSSWQAEISGSQGMTGVADTTIRLFPADFADKGRLYVTGRKCAERKWLVEFDASTLTWSLVGEETEHQFTPERSEIIKALADTYGGFLTPQQLAQATGLGNKSVFNMLEKLSKAGLVGKIRRGRYQLTLLGQKALKS